MSLLGALRWKARFLVEPERFVLADAEMPCVRRLREEVRNLTWLERVSLMSSAGRKMLRRNLLHRRLRRAEDGEPYFAVGGLRIFFRPSEIPDGDPELIQGVLTVLKEAYLDPDHFFSPEVRIRPGDCVFDLGGHLGTSAILFAHLTGSTGRVFSFEPVYHDLLRRNLRDNAVNGVEVVPCGVADRPGEVEFSVSTQGIDSRIARRWARGPKRLIPVTTLDRFVEERRISRVDFIKMDIEGAEELALNGATTVLRRFRPRLSLACYHTDSRGQRQLPRLVRRLEELGYEHREWEGKHMYAW